MNFFPLKLPKTCLDSDLYYAHSENLAQIIAGWLAGDKPRCELEIGVNLYLVLTHAKVEDKGNVAV